MASLLSYMLVITSVYQIVDGEDCRGALGMVSRKITDEQISASHWLYYKPRPSKNQHYRPQLARLNIESSSGGWCSEDNAKYSTQYIQIDLLKNTKLTAIATQGRFDSHEYTQAYQISYQRDNEKKLRKYKENGKWKLFSGNTDNKGIVTNVLEHRIIARKIRIYPRGDEFTIYCMRLELYGCKWEHSKSDVASYTAPLGSVINGIDTRDYDAYDGTKSTSKNLIWGGIGKLTDDIYGEKSIASSSTSPWVAYNINKPKITFVFHKKRLIRKVMIHVLSDDRKINTFRRALIRMGTSDGNFSTVTEYSSTYKQLNKVGEMAVWIDMGEILTNRIQIEFTKSTEWLLISEILFSSDDYPPKRILPVPTVNDVAATVVYQTEPDTKDGEDLLNNHVTTKMGDATKGLSFPIILTITLVTSALFIVLTIVIYKTYVKKKTDHVVDSRDTVPSPQMPVIDKQAVSLLYDQQRMKFHTNTLLQHGMYIQSYNPNGINS